MKKICEICNKNFETNSGLEYIVMNVVESQQEIIMIPESIKKLF